MTGSSVYISKWPITRNKLDMFLFIFTSMVIALLLFYSIEQYRKYKIRFNGSLKLSTKTIFIVSQLALLFLFLLTAFYFLRSLSQP